MGRIRSVKPELFLHEDLAELPVLTRYFFVGLFTQADREGRLEERPKRLKAALLPYDDVDVTALMDELVRRAFVRRYHVGGRALLYIPTFKKHQYCNAREPKSTLPAPPDQPEPAPTAPALATDEDDPPPVPESAEAAFDPIPARASVPTDDGDARARTCTHVTARGNRNKEIGKGKDQDRGEDAPARELPRGRRGLVSGPDPRIRRYGRVDVWQQQHEDFRRRLGVADVAAADRRLDAFYDQVESHWAATGEIPLGRPFEVWQREFDQAFASRAGYRRALWAPPQRPGGTSPRWEALCDKLEATGAINRFNRHQWLTPCRVLEDTGLVLRLHTSAAAVHWIRKFYGQALDDAIAAIAPDCRLELVADVDESTTTAAAGGQ